MRGKAQQPFLDRVDAAAQRSFSHREGGARGAAVFGADYVHDSLSLGQVELAVEKGAFCELARLRRNSARVEHGAKDELCDKQPSVAGELHHVLTRVAVRRAENQRDRFINSLAVRDYPAVGGGVALHLRKGLAADILKNTVGDAYRVFARDPYHADPALALSGADRGDRGVGFVHIILRRSIKMLFLIEKSCL